MSAFVVGREHIRFLVEAGFRRPNQSWGLGWFHAGNWHELKAGDYDEAQRVGQMLWDENVQSVRSRYPDCKFNGDLPGPIGEDYIYGEHRAIFGDLEPVAIFKAINCLDYQSCEHDGWKDSEAFAYLDSLRHAVICSLPGYDSAPWEVAAA